MNKNLTLFAMIFASTACVTHYAQAALLNIKIGIGVAACGDQSTCNVTINAIGDVVTVDIKGTPVVDLGTLSADEVKTLALPETPGTHNVYSLTPSAGDLANTKIHLLVQNREQKRGTRRADKHIFKFSRQLPGDKPNQWVEVGDLEVKKTEKLTEWQFIADKSGELTTFDTKGAQGTGSVKVDTDKPLPAGVKKVTFHVGRKDLTQQT